MIHAKENGFVLNTKDTTYAFTVTETGHLQHLYYGKRIDVEPAFGGLDVLLEKHIYAPGNTIVYNKENSGFSLEDMCLEMSSYGKGDIRDPFIEVTHSDGSVTSDFIYDSHYIEKSGIKFKTLPNAVSDSDTEHLVVVLKDKHYGLKLELHYAVFEGCNVITRASKLINESGDNVTLNRLMSTQIDFEQSGLKFTHFCGAWAREMNKNETVVRAGKFVNSSFTGTSSNRANPFVMISDSHTSEDEGFCYGLNLIYSGNHYESLEVSSFGKTRFVSGINPQSFEFVLEPGDVFESPEAVMCYSDKGYNGMSHCMHNFVREHIVRGVWQHKERPVLLNSWEAAYFNISEKKILKLARAAKSVGVELIVMDDGWFGSRSDDTSSLGDWVPNAKKLPNGISGLAAKIEKLGLKFGIWVEPEMVNADSELFRKHPDWALGIPSKPHSEGRNQRILDLTRKDVCDYIIKSMTDVFSNYGISYVKWDMNRIMSDVYSSSLPPERQGEVAHRYVIGLYHIMETLVERFPDILFEGCASGGNRFDLGILCYFPQIWASDNTDALCRVNMMTSYSYGYPMSTISAHVSACPNHQTLRTTPLDTRFNVSAFGILGYECNLCDMSSSERGEIKRQISVYKKYRNCLQFGDFYRGRNGNIHEWTAVDKDRKTAIGMLMQELVVPNMQTHKFFAKGLDENADYRFTGEAPKINIKKFGDLINAVSPVHIKNGSVVQGIISRIYKMPGETEDYTAKGSTLMNAGVSLKPAFSGTGYSEGVRYFQDFSSRMYFMQRKKQIKK